MLLLTIPIEYVAGRSHCLDEIRTIGHAQRSGGVVLPRTADWLEATAELRKAFVHHTQDEIQASLGRVAQKAPAS